MFGSKSHFFFQDQIFFKYPVGGSTSKILNKCASTIFEKFLNESDYKNRLSESFQHNFAARYDKFFDGFNYNSIDKNNVQKIKTLQKMAGGNQNDYKVLRYFYKEFQKYYTQRELRQNILEQRTLVESFFNSEMSAKPIRASAKSLLLLNKKMYMLQSDYYKWTGIPFFRNIFHCFPKYEDMIAKIDPSDVNYVRDLVVSKLRYLLEDSKKNGILSTLYMIPNIKKQQVVHNSYVISKCIARILNNDSKVLNSKVNGVEWGKVRGVRDKFYVIYQDAELTPLVDAVMAKFRHLDVRKVFFARENFQQELGFASDDGRHVVVNSTQALQKFIDGCD